jgi:hypothetical protein
VQNTKTAAILSADIQINSMLTGKELLDRVKELSNLSKTEMVRACGYASTGKNGKVRTNFTAFYEALLEAKGLSFGEDRPTRGRQASYRARIQGNGNLMIGATYTRELDLEPGTEFEIRLGRKRIALIPVGEDE